MMNSNPGLVCLFCECSLDNLSLDARQGHYERHLSQHPEITASVTGSAHFIGNNGAVMLRSSTPHKSDVFWYRKQLMPPPRNFTPGLINLLKKALWTSHSQGSTQRAFLCYEGAVHISQEFWDRRWGCGYRNFLMACAALMDQPFQPSYFALLDTPIPPGVRNLQVLIESAWNEGYDSVGSNELKNLAGSKKWIGTADLWVAFSYKGIPAELVDFNLKDHPRGAQVVVDWIVDYFSPKKSLDMSKDINDALRDASPIVVTDRMPIILQHDGHSRTIVGYEISKMGKVILLMFDPAIHPDKETRNTAILMHTSSHGRSIRSPKQIKNSAIDLGDRYEEEATIVGGSNEGAKNLRSNSVRRCHVPRAQVLNRFKLSTEKLKKKEYQILHFPMTSPLTAVERTQRKFVTSTRIT